MNTKGIKFLAVLAVLAMAFAAFAVVAPAETDDAGQIPATSVTELAADTVVADGKWYVVGASSAVLANTGAQTAGANILLMPGAKVSFSTGANQIQSFYQATYDATTLSYTYGNPLKLKLETHENVPSVENNATTVDDGNVSFTIGNVDHVTLEEGMLTYDGTTYLGYAVGDYSELDPFVISGTNHVNIKLATGSDETYNLKYTVITGTIEAAVNKLSIDVYKGATAADIGITYSSGIVVKNIAGDGAPTYTGVLSVDKGSVTWGAAPTSSGTKILKGYVGSGNIVNAVGSFAMTSATAYKFLMGTDMSGKELSAGADTIVAFGENTVMNSTVTMTWMSGTGLTISSAVQTGAAWTGSITFNATTTTNPKLVADGVAFGNATLNINAEIGTNNTTIFGNVTMGSSKTFTLTTGKTLTIADGTLSKVIVSDAAYGTLAVAAGKTASVSVSTATAEVYNISGVKAAAGGVTFGLSADLTDVTISGGYTEGTINCASTVDSVAVAATAEEVYGINAPKAALSLTTGNETTTVFNGDVVVKSIDINDDGEHAANVEFNGTKLTINGAASDVDNLVTFETGQGDNPTAINTGEYTLTINGPSVLAGKLNGQILLKANKAVAFGDFTVNSGSVVTFEAHSTAAEYEVTVTGNMYVYGTLKTSASDVNAAILVNDEKSFTAFGGALIDSRILIVAETDDSVINITQAQQDQEINKNITANKTYGQTENVIVTGSVYVDGYSVVTILGGFQVNEGKTLTIKNGSTVVIDSDVASVNIAGKIIVEKGGVFTVDDSKGVNISGTLTNKGTTTLNPSVTIAAGGKLLDEGTALTISATATVAAGGEVELKGTMATATSTITNSGTVILNGVTMADGNYDININMAAKGAIVEIKSVKAVNAGNDIVISDVGLIPAADASALATEKSNTITITPYKNASSTFKGLYVVEDTSYASSTKTWYGKMDLSGSVSNINANRDPVVVNAFTVRADGGVTVKDALTLGKSIVMTVIGTNDKSNGLTVSGKVTAIGDVTSQLNTGDNGVITVTGLVETTKLIGTTGKINAALYEVDVEGDSYYYYTTLAKAIESGADEIAVYGEMSVSSDLTIPADVEVTLDNDAKITIGSSSKRDIVVTVKEGATLKNGTVDVYATLYFEDADDDSVTTVISDVKVVGERSKKYTNVYTALNNAESGDTVTITKTDGNVAVSSDLTVKEGVILEIPVARAIELGPGVTLTVNGTVMGVDTIKLSSKTTGGWAEKASSIDKTAAIVIGPAGKLMTMGDMENALKEATSGVYFNLVDSIGNYYYVTNLPFAASKAANVTGGLLKVYGTVASISDIAVSGTSTQTAIVKVYGTLVAPLVLDYAVLNLADADSFTGYVENDTGEVYIADINGITVASTVSSGKDVLTLAGTAGLNEDLDDDEYAVIEIVSGTVETDDTLKIEVESEVTDEGAYRRSVLVNVDSGATLSVGSSEITTLVVDGTLSVKNGKAFTAEHAIVCGTITVADKASTSSAFGAYKIDLISLGIGFELFTGASGTLAGDLGSYKDLKGLIAVPSATFDKDLVKDAKYTTYMVGSVEYVTFYDLTSGTCSIDDIKVPHKDNATINGWTYGTDGAIVESGDMVGKYDVVKASYNEYIYTVRIVTDAGVKSVAIDGIEMISSSNNSFQQLNYLKAGTHTVSYTLKSGYEGTAQLYTADGTILKDLKFTASGTPVGEAKTVNLTFQLTGTEQIIAPEPTPVEQNEWTITTILLVILVILIAIMAVIVALRLNRS